MKRKCDAVQVIELWECVAHHNLGRASVEQATRTTFLHPAKSCRRENSAWSSDSATQGFWRTVASHPLSSQVDSFAVLVLFGRVWTMNVELLCS